MLLAILLSLSPMSPPSTKVEVDSKVEAKFELLKIKSDYAAKYAACKTQDQKLVVFVNLDNPELYSRLLKEYPSNTLYCFQKEYQGLEKGVVVGRYNNGTLERHQDVKPDALESLFKPKEQPKVQPKVEAVPKYPTRGNLWTGCDSWKHLTTGKHAGKFDSTWLQTLSWSELQSLHSDDHEGQVKWKYVVRCPK